MIKRILIVEVNWLGDVLFSTPMIRAVREKFKDAHIACMAVPRVKGILENNPCINEIIIYDEKEREKSLFGKLRFIRALRRRRFDLAILLHRSLTRTLLAFFAGVKMRAGYVTAKRRFFLTLPVEPPERDLHKVDYFLNIAGALGCDVSRGTCEFFVKGADRKYINDELSRENISEKDFLIVLNPGGNWPPKRWKEENFAKLADALIKNYNAKVAFSGGGSDSARNGRIKEMMKEKPAILSGKTNLKELGALMERANLVISGDSGPLHIAAAVGSDVIALFGPTSPELTGPRGSAGCRIVRKTEGCEIPCYELDCSDYKCMDAITVDDVLRVVKELHG